MTLQDVVSILTVVGFFVVAWWNNYANKKRMPFQNTLDNSTAMKSLNEAIVLATERALKAEEHASLIEERALQKIAEVEAKEEETTRKLSNLQMEFYLKNSLTYHIGFDVVLGTQPQILEANINHFVEKRTKEEKFEGEDKRHK
jgi:hypothetical protein